MTVKEQILELRSKGYTYTKIVEELGCSKSTVAYHCGEGQKEKSNDRLKRHRSGETSSREIKKFICLRSSCRAEFKKNRSNQNYCTPECGTADKREKKIQDYLSGSWDGNVQYGLSLTIRKYILELNNYTCSICGWNEVHPILGYPPVQVDHKDGDAYNQSLENLVVLCPNHHALTETYGNINGRPSTRKYRQTKK